MLCVQEIYETYKKDINKGRELLYGQTKAIIRQVLKTRGMYIPPEDMPDLKSTVFLKLDEKISNGKGNILLWTFSTIQEFLAQNKLLFLKIPRKKLNKTFSYIRLDDILQNQKTKKELTETQDYKNKQCFDFTRTFMNEHLTVEENIIITTKYSDTKNKPSDINKQLKRRLKKTIPEIEKIEKSALNKIKNILNC